MSKSYIGLPAKSRNDITYALTTLTFGSVITSWSKDVFGVSLPETGHRDLILKKGQRQPLGGDLWVSDCTRELVKEGEDKTFAGYTFKSITLVD